MAAAVPAQGTVWTRDYLRKQGIPDEAITWDPQSGSIAVYGKKFKPTYVSPDGKSYATPDALNQFAQAAYGPAQRLQNRIQALGSWKYDPNQDPAYQQAQKDITRDTMEGMNSKGMLLYSGTPERIAQAVSQARPQYEAAAYNRQQAQIQNATALLDRMTQQQNADRNFALDEAQVTGVYNGQPTEAARAKQVAEAAAAAKATSGGSSGGSDSSGSSLSASAQKAQEQLELSRLVAQDNSPAWETYTPEQKRLEALTYVDQALTNQQISVTTYYKLLAEIDRRWPLPKQTGTSEPSSVGGN